MLTPRSAAARTEDLSRKYNCPSRGALRLCLSRLSVPPLACTLSSYPLATTLLDLPISANELQGPPSDQGQLPAPLCRMLAQDRCCLLALPVKLSHPVRAHSLHPWSPSSIAKFHRSIFDALCVRRHSTVRYSTGDPVSATRQLYREAGDSGHSVHRRLEGLRTLRLCKVSLPRASTDSHSNASKPERSHPQDLPKCTEIDVSTSLLPHGLC